MASTPSEQDVAGAPTDPSSSAMPPVPLPRDGATARRASMYALPTGHRLHEFELTEHIGEGGFSIVYRALDHSLERVVALKEYMPGSLATRDDDTTVRVRNESMQETFEAGLRSFVNESKLLASFDHPSLVKVYRFWEANGTAYMVMPFYEGLTLKDTVQRLAGRPSQVWIQDMLSPLVEALSYIHQRLCFHRDIAPDNIVMLADSGRPLLLDFGAARRVITDMTQALTVIVKAGYAPIEQYAAMPDMTQGPWTDVHALAAVVYWMVTGDKPPAAISRVLKDTYVPLVVQQPPGYSLDFLRAVDRGLALRPENRTPSIDAFAEELGLRQTASHLTTSLRLPPSATRPPEPPDRTTTHAVTEVDQRAADESPDDGETVAMPHGGISLLAPIAHMSEFEPAPAPAPARAPAPAPAPVERKTASTDHVAEHPVPARARAPIVLAAGVLAILLVGLGIWLALRRFEPTVPAMGPVTTSPAPAPVPTQAVPLPEVRSARPVAASAAIAPLPEPASAPIAPAPVAPVAPVKSEATSAREHSAAPAARHASTSTGANATECARILQRLSLGDSSQELLERMSTLHCK